MAEFHFRCSECDTEYAEDPALLVCPDCAERQLPGGEVRGVLQTVLERLPGGWPARAFTEVDSLAAWLPLRDTRQLSGWSAGGTPLLPAEPLRRRLETPRLWIKDETRNPSGSLKDRASQLVVAKALEYGVKTVATASTGNAASALATAAAAVGLECVILAPADAPLAKLVQVLCCGGRLVPVQGTYDQAFELCNDLCRRHGWYNRNTALNPFTIEGKKTAALEIAAQLAPRQADAVLVPCGDGVILAGLAKGFADLRTAGLITRVPRLIAVQPEGSPALVRALHSGAATVEHHAGAASVADSLVVGTPRNARLCLREIRASGGAGVVVSDQQILQAQRELACHSGVFAEPAGAAALAGLHQALDQGLLRREECLVLLITGNGLKDVPAAARSLRMPAAVAATPDAVERALASPATAG